MPFCFGNLNPRDYHGDSLSVMFPRISNFFLPFPLVFSACFSRCFYGFLRCFSCFPALFPLFPILDFTSKKKSLARVTPYMNISKKTCTHECVLEITGHSCANSSKINRLHEHCLRIIYSDD